MSHIRYLFMVLMIINIQTFAKGYAQTHNITIRERNKTVEEILGIIEEKANVYFFYNDKEVDLKRKVTIEMVDQPLSKVLETLFKDSSSKFVIDGNQVYISKKPEAKLEQQPDIRITGRVSDNDDAPLPGASVFIKGTSLGVVTDINGNFSITVPGKGSVLQFSFVGYATQEFVTGDRTTLDVVLAEIAVAIEEIVVVAYATQKKVSVTGAVSSVQTKELRQSSAANLSAALAGRMPGLMALQTSGQPGNDEVNLYLRGIGTLNDATPLILIDGVPRTNISVLDPNEIASVSILKDASATAVFGVRGANGAILITTRRGTPGKTELSLTIDQSFQQFTGRATRIHSWEFAELRNQAFLNSNPNASDAQLPFTQYMIDMYKSGEDPVFYPDRDVFHDYFRDWSPQTRVNLNLSGGTEKVSYFLNVGYVGQGGQFKTEPESYLGYDPSYKMDRYTFRSNVDYSITNNLKLSLNIGTYLEKTNAPQVSGGIDQTMSYYWATPPTDPGPLTVAGYGVPVGEVLNQSGLSNSRYGEINRTGYQQETGTQLNSSIALDYKLDFIAKGLIARAMMAFDVKARTIMNGVRLYDVYSFSVARTPEETNSYNVLSTNKDVSISLSQTAASFYYMNFQGSLNYARSFGRHDVGAMTLFQRDNYERSNYAADLPFNVVGIVGRVTYGFDERYLAELNVGYNGTEQFAPDNRFGFFPAVSAGWVISNERFFKDNPVLTHLKLRASFGKVGNDKLGDYRFLYLTKITRERGDISSLGRGNRITQGLMANEAIQWEESFKQNYGLDVQLWKGLTINADVFLEKRDKILIGRNTVPVLQGVPLTNVPRVNMGKVNNKGYELELTYRKIVNSDFSFTVRGNYAYNENKVIEADEPRLSEEYAYRYRKTGYSVGQNFVYQVDYSNETGFINTLEELEEAKKMYNVGGVPRLGDLKYLDVNEDGVIDVKDLSPVGYSDVPRIGYGFSASMNYRNIDFSFLLSGIAKTNRLFSGNGWGATEFGLVGFYTDWHLKAWTQERYNKYEEILYPALGLSAGSSQPMVGNSFYLLNRSFLRLKNIELGYTLPQKWLEPVHISRVRMYVNGNNLLTWKKYPINTIDPEANIAPRVYPITRMVNAGVNVVF